MRANLSLSGVLLSSLSVPVPACGQASFSGATSVLNGRLELVSVQLYWFFGEFESGLKTVPGAPKNWSFVRGTRRPVAKRQGLEAGGVSVSHVGVGLPRLP